MAKPTQTTVRRLFAMSGNFCAFPGCNRHVVDISTGTIFAEICHIHAKRPKGPRYNPLQSEKERNGYDNLILLCADHHKIVDTSPDHFPAETLAGMKKAREDCLGREERAGDGEVAKMLLSIYSDRLTIEHVAGDLNLTSFGPVEVKKTVRRITRAPTPGTIGADQKLVRYSEYLIRKYNEMASKDPFSSRKFNYAAIRKNIVDRFKAPSKDISIDKFQELVAYLQGRIERTSMAKINKGKGWKSYETYDEFQQKHE